MESVGTDKPTAIKEIGMSLIINTNAEALIAQNNLTGTENGLNTAMTDLSSGLRINTAADDAAGYAITEDLTSQVNGLNQANSNAQDATSLVQTADGALNDVAQMLQRVRELAVEYQGGTLDSTDQNAIVSEVQQLASQIEQIGNQAQFNGISLFAPTGANGTGNLTFQVGANDNEVISIKLQALVGTNGIISLVDTITSGIGKAGSATSLSLGANGVLATLSAMIDAVSTLASAFGAVQNRLSYTMNNLSTYSENLTSAQSTIQDVDMAAEMTEFTKDQILEQSGISMLSQAEQNPQQVLKLLGVVVLSSDPGGASAPPGQAYPSSVGAHGKFASAGPYLAHSSRRAHIHLRSIEGTGTRGGETLSRPLVVKPVRRGRVRRVRPGRASSESAGSGEHLAHPRSVSTANGS